MIAVAFIVNRNGTLSELAYLQSRSLHLFSMLYRATLFGIYNLYSIFSWSQNYVEKCGSLL